MNEDPERRLREGLIQVAGHYQPHRHQLFNDGVGHGTKEVREALRVFVEQSGDAAIDRAEVGWRTFVDAAGEQPAIPLVRAVFDDLLAAAKQKIPTNQVPASAILSAGSVHQPKPRSSPGSGLRFWPAGSGST